MLHHLLCGTMHQGQIRQKYGMKQTQTHQTVDAKNEDFKNASCTEQESQMKKKSDYSKKNNSNYLFKVQKHYQDQIPR